MISEQEIQDKKQVAQPQKSVQGWIIIVTQLHDESMEDDVFDTFSKYGQVKSLHLNMDRRTGFAKGYALIQYEQFEEAQEAIKQMNGKEIYDQKVKVDWAFKTSRIAQKTKN